MFSAHPLPALLSQYLQDLLAQLDAVRGGSEEGIHQARVGIRRLRETLSLGRWQHKKDELDGIEPRLAKAGRALSRVRDADVEQRLIQDMATRFIVAARPLAYLRAAVMQEQVALRRRAIKKLEDLELESLAAQIRLTRRQGLGWLASGRQWRDTLAHHMASRAADVHSSIEQAGGVYFPNRLHSARVAIKHLRYTFEVADRTGVSRPRGALGVLKKAQEILGEAHDRQVLLARVEDLRDAHADWNRDEGEALQQFMRAEILSRHENYVSRRPDIVAVCNACVSGPRRSHNTTRALVAAGVIVPSVVFLRSRFDSAGPAARKGPVERPRRAKTA